MAQGLLIKPADLKKFTTINGNVDDDLIIQYIKIAQDIHLQNILGTDLLDKLDADVVTSTLAGNYSTLVSKWIKPCLVHWALVEYLPFASITIADKGVYKHTSENAQNVEKNEMDSLVEKHRDTAEHYSARLIKHLCNNNDLYPEYLTNSDDDMRPDSDVTFSGWFL